MKVCKTLGRYSVEVKVPSLFEDQTTSWIRIVGGVEKYVREAMPIQEEEKASGKPAAKARPTLKPALTSNWIFIPMEQRKLIDIEVKRSEDHYGFQMSKFITQLLRHTEVRTEEDAEVPYDRIVEKSKEVLSEDSRYWSDEIKEKFCTAPHWSAEKWIDVLSKGGGPKKKVSILFETKLSRKTPVPLSHSRSFRKSLSLECSYQPCIARQRTVTERILPSTFHHVGHGKELRSIVRNGLVKGGFSTKNGRCAVFFTVEDPMDDEQGLRETFCDLSKARIAPHKNTWKPLQDTLCWCNLLPAQEGGLQFYHTRSNAVYLFDTLPAQFIETAICMKTKRTALPKRKRKTTCCSQSKFAVWITSSTQSRSKIIL